MRRIDLQSAESLIDFSGGSAELTSLASQQLTGAVALYNRLCDQKTAYLADEVGMGKTYIALGVIALMRRFKPDLRVLYLLPKVNVREKWVKDYRNFIEYNYRQTDGLNKNEHKLPAQPYLECRSLEKLTQDDTLQRYQDIFICTSAFSFRLGNDVDSLQSSLSSLADGQPQYTYLLSRANRLLREAQRKRESISLTTLKAAVKDAWAAVLCAKLPEFDLVVVDEAHNLKHGLGSSDRNRMLAKALGKPSENHVKRARRLLLLSATPFDRSLNHLHNQFDVLGFADEAALPEGGEYRSTAAKQALKRLLIRRLNTLQLAGKAHTRNMYRVEHRKGPQAEAQMTLKQQLVAALFQKKVSEHLQQNCAGRFELGMLASFESYRPGKPVKEDEFDGQAEQPVKHGKRDAQDRHVVKSLIESYHSRFKTIPPHPKMDWVAEKSYEQAFEHGKKQLIFVRRILSVSELKFKLERAYDAWLGHYIRQDACVLHWFQTYEKNRRRVSDASLAEHAGEEEAQAGNETFFSWFYKGVNSDLAEADSRLKPKPLPVNFRTQLAQSSYMFEINWTRLPGMPDPDSLCFKGMPRLEDLTTRSTPRRRFRMAQYVYLNAVKAHGDAQARLVAQRVLAFVYDAHSSETQLTLGANCIQMKEEMERDTFWDALRTDESLKSIAPAWDAHTFSCLADADAVQAERYLRRLVVHAELLGVVCRLDHPFIDLYALRSARSAKDESHGDGKLITKFCERLREQSRDPHGFNSYRILLDIAENLDLLVKLNFDEAYRKAAGDLTRYLTAQLNPLQPIAGATGENGHNRSHIARKFRMPGYPRILVSTEVLQEGEDLHTFCDSVQHYGLSATPIALEQKVGRVDRVGSLAQRQMEAAGPHYAEHFIQVSFPHIRESLESIQVREVARNLNQFLLSLHNLEQTTSDSTQLELSAASADPEDIPAQISTKLESPYEVQPADLAGAAREFQATASQTNELEEA